MRTETYVALFCLSLVLGCGQSPTAVKNNTPPNDPTTTPTECVADFAQMPKPFGLRLGMSVDEFAKVSPEIGAALKNYRKVDPYGDEHTGSFTFNDQGTKYTGVSQRSYGIKELDHIEALFRDHRLMKYLIYYKWPEDYTKASQEMIDYLEQIGAKSEPKGPYDLILSCNNIIVEFDDKRSFNVRDRSLFGLIY